MILQVYFLVFLTCSRLVIIWACLIRETRWYSQWIVLIPIFKIIAVAMNKLVQQTSCFSSKTKRISNTCMSLVKLMKVMTLFKTRMAMGTGHMIQLFMITMWRIVGPWIPVLMVWITNGFMVLNYMLVIQLVYLKMSAVTQIFRSHSINIYKLTMVTYLLNELLT